jgi:hypothetical protein
MMPEGHGVLEESRFSEKGFESRSRGIGFGHVPGGAGKKRPATCSGGLFWPGFLTPTAAHDANLTARTFCLARTVLSGQIYTSVGSDTMCNV